MKIIMNRIPEYKIWRKKSKGKPGSKLAKKMIRENIRSAVRSARLKENGGKAKHGK